MARGKKKKHAVTLYAEDVVTGRIPANRWVRLACRRHLDDLEHEKARGLLFNEAAADHIVAFFEEFLVFYEGEFDGKPFLLQPWQKFIVGSLFGWKTTDGFRRFRISYNEIAKGNGKSPLAAGIGLYGLLFDEEAGAEVYSAATSREQANILFRDARAFADGSDALKESLIVERHNITYEAGNSFFRPVSSEHRGLDGKRPHIALIDEIHEHRDSMVVDKIRAGTKGRRQALIFEITNSGYDRHSVCFQHREYSEKVLDGVIVNDSWFAYITGLDPCPACAADGKTFPTDGCPDCDDWRDERVWPKANPNLGISIKRKYLREQVDEAMEMPSKENIVKRLNFCIWTESATKWLSMEKWQACGASVDPEALKGRTCYAGLDLSSTTDVTALVLVFPPDMPDEKYHVLCRFFIPRDNMRERVRRDRVPYDVWVRQGFVIATEGSVVDYGFVLAQIRQDSSDYQIAELAFDRWGSQKIVADLQDLGFEIEGKCSLVQFGQGFASMSAPTKELERMILSGELAHGNNPVLTWMASNAVVQTDPAGNLKVAKDRSTEKVDGIIALIMALDRAVKNAETVSVYEGLSKEAIMQRMVF